jgi:hypothetical protein
MEDRSMTLMQMFRAGTLKICNCCECQRPLLGTAHRAQYAEEVRSGELDHRVPPLVGGRFKDRPYCARDYNALMNNEPERPSYERVRGRFTIDGDES